MNTHHGKELSRFMWLSLVGLAFVGWYGTRAPAPPVVADPQADAVWFVRQLERDRIAYPERHTQALNKCMTLAIYSGKGHADWPYARRCYSLLVDRM